MNINYRRGRAKEYRVAKKLKEQGFDIVQRSAGSHSPVDVFAIHRKNKIIKLVQVKPKKFNPKKIEEEMSWLNDEFIVSFEVG